MTEAEVRAAIALAEAARQGPWFAVHGLSEEETGMVGGTAPDVIREGVEDGDPDEPYRESLVDFMGDAEADFIASAREDVPALGAEVLRLQDLLWTVRDRLDDPSAASPGERGRIARMIEDVAVRRVVAAGGGR